MRNLTGASRSTKSRAYKTMVRPIMEYTAPVWDPIHQTQIDQLEAVQRRTARQIYGDYSRNTSPSDLLTALNLPSLESRRKKSKLASMYKLVNSDANSSPPPNVLQPKNTGHQTRGHNRQFTYPHCRTNCYKQSFYPSAIKLWNNLPMKCVSATSTETFKVATSGIFD